MDGEEHKIAPQPTAETAGALKLIAKGAGLTFIGLAFSKAVSYLFRLIISRLGPDNYGLFSLGFGVFDIASTIALLGLSWGVLRFVPEYASQKRGKELADALNSSFLLALASSIFTATVLFLASGFIATSVFHDARLTAVLVIFALAIPFYNVEAVAISACRAFKRVEYEVIAKYFVENSLKLILASLAVFAGAGFLRVTGAFAAAIAFTSVVSLLLLNRLQPLLPSLAIPSRKSMGVLLDYSLPLMLSNVVWLFVAWSDTVFLGVFRTVGEVGVYNTALPTAALLLLAPVALEIAFKPITVELVASRKMKDFKRVFSSLTKWIFLLNLPILVFFVVFNVRVMRTLFGEPYAIAGLPLAILATGYFVNSLLNLGDDIMGAYNKTRKQLRNALAAAGLSVVLNLLLVPAYGIAGAAVATSVALMLYGVLSFSTAYKLLGFHPFSADFVKIIAAALAAAALAWVFAGLELLPSLAWSAAVGGVFIGAYCLALLMLVKMDADDLLIVDSVSRKVKTVFRIK